MDHSALVFLSMPYEVSHMSCMFNGTCYFWGEPFLNAILCISVL